MKSTQHRFAIVITTALVFLWGFVLNLNSTLISYLKKAYQLSDAQSTLIVSASYIAYFVANAD